MQITPAYCRACGTSRHNDKGFSQKAKEQHCPAWGKECNNCDEKNHFRAACPKPPRATPKKGKGPQDARKERLRRSLKGMAQEDVEDVIGDTRPKKRGGADSSSDDERCMTQSCVEPSNIQHSEESTLSQDNDKDSVS